MPQVLNRPEHACSLRLELCGYCETSHGLVTVVPWTQEDLKASVLIQTAFGNAEEAIPAERTP